jgi:hypothetical protein
MRAKSKNGGGDITLVASGVSVRGIALDRLVGRVIGVNEAAYHLPRVDVVVSMDRLWAELRWQWMGERAAETWLRRSAVQNLDIEAALAAGWLHVFDCDHESAHFATARGNLNGTHSGLCALNLAWTLRPTRLFLLGFDMRAPSAWPSVTGTKTTAGKYTSWAPQFKHAARRFAEIGCDVWNVSERSAITVFRKMAPAQYLQECAR